MKRFTATRTIVSALKDTDISIFIGSGLSKEAAEYVSGDNNIFLDDSYDYLLSFSLGIAMTTDKRVFVFCDDQYIIRNLSEIVQLSVSKCKNLFLVLFVSGVYSSVSNTPIIFDSVNSKHGMFYNMGFVVHDYTQQFKLNKNPVKNIRGFIDRVRGPLVIIMTVEPGTKKFSNVDMVSSIEDFSVFVRDKNIASNMYEPPLPMNATYVEQE